MLWKTNILIKKLCLQKQDLIIDYGGGLKRIISAFFSIFSYACIQVCPIYSIVINKNNYILWFLFPLQCSIRC